MSEANKFKSEANEVCETKQAPPASSFQRQIKASHRTRKKRKKEKKQKKEIKERKELYIFL